MKKTEKATLKLVIRRLQSDKLQTGIVAGKSNQSGSGSSGSGVY